MLNEVEMAQTLLCPFLCPWGFQVFSVVGILSFGTQFVRWRKRTRTRRGECSGGAAVLSPTPSPLKRQGEELSGSVLLSLGDPRLNIGPVMGVVITTDMVVSIATIRSHRRLVFEKDQSGRTTDSESTVRRQAKASLKLVCRKDDVMS
jgi:hypothetical protein